MAKKGEAYLQKLFLLEQRADDLCYSDSQRLELRQTESAKVMEKFYEWLEPLSFKTLPQSLLGKAITYAQNQKEYLCNFLKDAFKSTIDAFLSDKSIADDRYRVACARFLLYLQNNSLNNISELDYNVLLQFHQEDYHCSSKSKNVYEDLIRVFLRYLAAQGMCSFGLSLTLNKLLIHQIIKLSDEELNSPTDQKYPSVTWSIILEFLTKMNDVRYGKTVLNSSQHILTLLYIFLDMHQICLDDTLLWHWFDKITPLLGTGWKQHRRTLFQFLDF